MVGKELSTDQLFLLRTGINFFVLDELGHKFGKIVKVKWSDKPKGGFSQSFGKI